MRRITLITGVISVLLLGGCSDKDAQRTLHVGMPVWPGYELLNVAVEKELNEGVEVVINILPTTSETKTAFKNGIIDVAALTLDEVLHLAQEVPDIRVFLITDISNGGDAILGQPGMTSLEQLKGRVVGLESNALSSYLLARAVEINGKVALDELIIHPIGAAGHEELFKTKKVDALVTYEPLKTLLKQNGAGVLFDSAMIPGEIIDVLIVRESVAESREKELHALVRGWFRALSRLRKNPGETVAMMAQNEGVPSSDFSMILQGLVFPSLEKNRRFFQESRNGSNGPVRKVYSFMESKRIVTRPVDLKRLFTDRFLPENEQP